MKHKSLLFAIFMVGGPIVSGFFNHDLQLVWIGIDLGVIGTLLYISLSLYRKMKDLGEAMQAGIKAMKEATRNEESTK